MPEGLSTDGKEGGYVDKVGNQAYIYTGELEPPYLNRLEGHPYLDTRNYRKGALAFDGGVYPGIGMRLNVYIERLIVLSPDRRLHVIVPPERIPLHLSFRECSLCRYIYKIEIASGME